jgi:hypothetical protein
MRLHLALTHLASALSTGQPTDAPNAFPLTLSAPREGLCCLSECHRAHFIPPWGGAIFKATELSIKKRRGKARQGRVCHSGTRALGHSGTRALGHSGTRALGKRRLRRLRRLRLAGILYRGGIYI